MAEARRQARAANWDEEIELLARALPPDLARALHERIDPGELLEIVLDLGREPEARVPGREVLLADHPVSASDLEHVANNVGQFGDDNRAGIERTLHRVSAIRNRSGRIVGLTMRVGRAVTGTGEIIRDIVISGQSILLLGRPGIGKTTMLRECARLLADELRKRVVIVDTSNEIGGDGDIPHPGIGRARRMQVKTPLLQHAVMIEAVENHMPEVIVIDEIGTELEAAAARTIAERGVQLVRRRTAIHLRICWSTRPSTICWAASRRRCWNASRHPHSMSWLKFTTAIVWPSISLWPRWSMPRCGAA